MLQEVNVEALHRAAVALVGPQVADAIGQLYMLIDKAMFDGYELGRMDAEQNVEERMDAAFDQGWDEGVDFANEYPIASYDEGYADGVADARARPAIADETIADIISDCAQYALNGEFDLDNVTDSGDETD